MKAASLKELKTELGTLHPSKLMELCLHLAKYKKENKELLTYLLFEADDEPLYIKEVNQLIDELFADINRSNLYIAKKMLRKILRTTNKYIKYSGSKQTEVELLLHFCLKMKKLKLPLSESAALSNIYLRQVLKIKKSLASLHEDLQLNYEDAVNAL